MTHPDNIRPMAVTHDRRGFLSLQHKLQFFICAESFERLREAQ
jgi:hypothetical protein